MPQTLSVNPSCWLQDCKSSISYVMAEDAIETTLTPDNNGLKGIETALTLENNELEGIETTLTPENNELEGIETTLTPENNDLEGFETTLTLENDEFKGIETTLTLENNELEGSETTLTPENNELEGSETTLTPENNELKGIETTLTLANNELEGIETTLTPVKNKLEGTKTTLTPENNELEGTGTTLTLENNELEGIETTLTPENNELEGIETMLTPKNNELEGIETTLTPEYNELEGTETTLTPENNKLKAHILRRNSTGKIGFKNNRTQVLSRYLSGRIASCHHFCKYGGKQDTEAKEMSPMLKRSKATLTESPYLERFPNLAKRKMKKVISHNTSPDSKIQVPNKVSKREVSSSAKNMAVSKNDASTPGKGICTSHSSDLKLQPLPVTPPSLSPTEHMRIEKNSMIRKNKKMEGRQQNSLGSPSKRFRNSKNLKGMSRQRNQNNARRMESAQVCHENVPEKTIYIIVPEAENKTDGSTGNGSRVIQLSSSLTSSSDNKGRRCALNRIQSTKSSESKNVRHTRIGIHMTRSPSLLSPSFKKKSLRNARNGTHGTQLASSSSAQLPSSMSPFDSAPIKESGAITEHNETETQKQRSNLKVTNKGRPRKGVILSSLKADNHPPRKLHFRRGKVVELQSENNIPRRLRFRQVRVQGENQNGNATIRRSFRKREVVDGELNGIYTKSENIITRRLKFKEVRVQVENQNGNAIIRRSFRKRGVVDGELNGTNTKSEKVVLRHQDVKEKKDSQSSFNNVIEETASKLSKTRKSKVKALVDAFETVISLQETKPPAVTSIC